MKQRSLSPETLATPSTATATAAPAMRCAGTALASLASKGTISPA